MRPSRPEPVSLISGSAAEDASHRTAVDIAVAATQANLPYRLIGGLAVSILHAAFGSPGEVPHRLTADADLGVDDQILVGSDVGRVLEELGYTQVEGNRFIHGSGVSQRTIDVLVPTMGDHLVTNIPVGPLRVDAVPGLRLALDTPPLTVALTAVLSSGEALSADLSLPGVVPATVLKAYAFAARSEPRDLLDLWKLLEVAHLLGLSFDDWEPMRAQKRDAALVLHDRVGSRPSVGATMSRRHGWPHARLAALVQTQVPNPRPH